MKIMKFLICTLVLSLCFNISPTLTFAQSEKTITLKDGSVLNGVIKQLTDGTYTIATDNLGDIDIPEDNIKSIAEANDVDAVELRSQVQAVQSDIMSDPDLMNDIEALLENEEIMKIIQDENFVNDVMSFNADKIEGNQNTQQLLNNPAIQDLMNKIESKLGEGEEE